MRESIYSSRFRSFQLIKQNPLCRSLTIPTWNKETHRLWFQTYERLYVLLLEPVITFHTSSIRSGYVFNQFPSDFYFRLFIRPKVSSYGQCRSLNTRPVSLGEHTDPVVPSSSLSDTKSPIRGRVTCEPPSGSHWKSEMVDDTHSDD